DLFFYDWLREGPRLHGFRHPAIAHRNARKIATLSKKEEDIIKKHMWPLTLLPPCYAESFIVCMVDTFCSVRDYMKHHKDDKHGKHIYVGH
ncbi:MAG: phosphohydrolase, partial [Deltaproteobacteria bacterium]|nr:phosphohydrolase [Deltaproteobacteria bacterium]